MSQPGNATTTRQIGGEDVARESVGSRVNFWLCAVVTLAAAVVPAVLWVGDISWIQDEPRLIAKAYHANAGRTLETHGLNGNFGVPYGPLPTQIYQAMLLVTHDPVTLAGIHAALNAGVTAIGLLWLARSLRLNPWFATAIVLAPYLWNFHRILWDASFAVPIGTIAFAAYIGFLRTSSAALLTTVAAVSGLAVIHPQDIPLLFPIVAHLLWRRRGFLARHYIGIALVLGVVAALNARYPRKVVEAVMWHTAHGSMHVSYPGEPPPRGQAILSPMLGGTILGGRQFVDDDSKLREPAPLVKAAVVGSMLVYPLSWTGIGLAILTVRPRRRNWLAFKPAEERDADLLALRKTVLGLALTTLVLQTMLHGATRIPVQPQYFFGTFVVHALFAWVGIEVLRRIRLHWLAIALYGVSVGYITIASSILIHHRGYVRNLYDQRPSLANQAEVARGLNRYANTEVLTDVEIFTRMGQSIRTLRLLIPPAPGETQPANPRLMIRYRSGSAGTDSDIELVELDPAADTKDLATIDVTPLPPNWHPAKW